MRLSRYAFSEAFIPWMRGVTVLADAISKNRDPLPENHPLVEMERDLIGQLSEAIESARKMRDSGYELAFGLLYGGSSEQRTELHKAAFERDIDGRHS